MSCTYIHAYGQWWSVSVVWLLVFVYICLCSLPVTYCCQRVQDAHILYPVAIYTVPLIGQRLQIAPMPPRPFYPRTVMCHPPGGSPNRLTLLPLTTCLLLRTCCWHRSVFLSYRFGTRLFKLHAYLSSQLIIIRQLHLL